MLRMLRTQVARLNLQSRVSFCGPLYGKERIEAYVDADIFSLTPRFFEETSLAALEAAACGTATVVTPQCEIPELASAGGGIVSERNVEAISGDLAVLLKDPARRSAMGKVAREHVSGNFTAARVAEQHEQLFDEVIA
jgi:poly(glycerol-phosphate) alpha-glucosyltransferase